MSEMPTDLQSDPPGSEQRLVVKPLNTLEQIHRTLDSIRYNRATGRPWGPLVDHLFNLCGGLRDKQFWDGLPPDARKKVEDLEATKDPKSVHQAKQIRLQWEQYGWNGVYVRARPNPDGSPRFLPTMQDLDQMLEILMQLLHRRNVLWKTRLYSPLPPMPGEEGGDGE